jgi:hypothetical protein
MIPGQQLWHTTCPDGGAVAASCRSPRSLLPGGLRECNVLSPSIGYGRAVRDDTAAPVSAAVEQVSGVRRPEVDSGTVLDAGNQAIRRD